MKDFKIVDHSYLKLLGHIMQKHIIHVYCSVAFFSNIQQLFHVNVKVKTSKSSVCKKVVVYIMNVMTEYLYWDQNEWAST